MRYLMLIVGFLVGSMATAAPSRDRSGDVTPLLKMSLDEVAAQVPIGSGFQFIGCPNCNGGSQENGVLEWKPGMGDTVKCRRLRNGRMPTISIRIADRNSTGGATWIFRKT